MHRGSARPTKETMQPCPLYIHSISLVARTVGRHLGERSGNVEGGGAVHAGDLVAQVDRPLGRLLRRNERHCSQAVKGSVNTEKGSERQWPFSLYPEHQDVEGHEGHERDVPATSRVAQHVAIGMAAKASLTTRLKDVHRNAGDPVPDIAGLEV